MTKTMKAIEIKEDVIKLVNEFGEFSMRFEEKLEILLAKVEKLKKK